MSRAVPNAERPSLFFSPCVPQQGRCVPFDPTERHPRPTQLTRRPVKLCGEAVRMAPLLNAQVNRGLIL